jgi:hypothetical protein
VIEKVVSSCKAAGAQTILSWVPPGNRVSYDWLKARARQEGIAFNDWYPSMQSELDAIPSLPPRNPHSGGHYRGWVAGLIADGFRREMLLH